ncbi:acyl carrier protein [Streptomyces sp. NPDC048290]|uniref:acyl carrier protein n=1 Tax=Streptomyces sp. NPDC048290 TaxID=3155811 RepID=UPI003442E1A1
MSELTLTELTTILRECAGQDENTDLSGADILDKEFKDLGYDSLAMLETAARIQIVHGVVLADDVVVEAATPRELIRLVNQSLGDARP